MKIAVLEDDRETADFIKNTLSGPGLGYSCETFHDGKSLVRTLKYTSFDLLILDWMVPGMSGKTVLEWVRRNWASNVPVIFLTARNLESDVASILNSGADDYIIKPVSPRVLAARVRALFRRAYSNDNSTKIEKYGLYEFRPKPKTAFLDGAAISMTPREFELAIYLFRHADRPIPRSAIISTIWKDEISLNSRTLETHISWIRRKLQIRPEHGYRLIAIYGYGYRLESLLTAETYSN